MHLTEYNDSIQLFLAVATNKCKKLFGKSVELICFESTACCVLRFVDVMASFSV